MPFVLRLTILLTAGLAVGILTPPSVARWAPTVLAVTVAAAALAHPRDQRWLRQALLAASLVSAAVLHGDAALQRAERPPLRAWLDARAPGFAIDDAAAVPRLDDPLTLEGRLTRDASMAAGGVSLQLMVSRVSPGQWLEPAEGGVLLTVVGEQAARHIDDWRAGRVVRLSAVLRRPARYLDAGVPDGERALARRGIALVGTVKSAALVEVVARGSWWSERAAQIRASVRSAMVRHVAVRDPRSAAIGTAILIGDRASLDTEVERRLQEAGTYHVVAISGGNIALVAAVVTAVLWAAGVRFAVAALLTIGVLVVHGYVIGGGASVVRATVMAVLYLGLRAMDQRTPPANAIALGAALMLLRDPLEIVDAGFWLTFGASTALIALSAWWPATSSGRTWRAAAALCMGSLAVELVLAPVSALIFQRITLAGLVLNLAAIPCMAVVQAAASLTVAASAAGWAGLADWAGAVTDFAARGLIQSARGVDLAPWLTWRVPSPQGLVVAVYYGSLAAWWARSRQPADTARRRHTVRVLACATLALWAWIAMAPQALVRRLGDGRLHLTMMDVGQGDALLVTFPNGTTLMVDSGGLSQGGTFDVGDRVLGPALRARGLVRVDYLAVTHGDPDHIGGSAALVRDFEPVEVWAGVPVASHDPTDLLMAEAKAVRSTWRWLQRSDRLEIGGASVTVHHPPLPDWERQRVRNDDSLVLEVAYGDVSLLLTGDIGATVERELLPQLAPRPIVILKSPHHGSATSSSASLLAHLRPRAVLISAGRGNPFGHPTPVVLRRYDDVAAEVFRTDRDGQIELVTDGRTVEVSTYTGRRWRLP